MTLRAIGFQCFFPRDLGSFLVSTEDYCIRLPKASLTILGTGDSSIYQKLPQNKRYNDRNAAKSLLGELMEDLCPPKKKKERKEKKKSILNNR